MERKETTQYPTGPKTALALELNAAIVALH